MAFNSVQYLVFFVTVACVYFTLPSRYRLGWLLLASYFFYASADWLFLVHLIAVTVVIYFLGIRIDAEPEKAAKKRLLTYSIVALVFNLILFKYTLFFNDSLRTLAQTIGIPYPVPAFQILLPIGISFYTFSLASYVVDIYKGMRAETHIVPFALYVSFFPKIVAGPIERAKTLIPQFLVQHNFDYERSCFAIQLILWGAFKKIVVADRIAPFVARVYDNPQAVDGVAVTVATVLYAFQIYCDFSGYTDIAIGSALILGFKLMNNFNRPYIATSIQDYWKRWHISLTSWLTEYVYTPMSRTTAIRIKWFYLMLLSIFATFVLSGFWHGAKWTFVAWGALHGSYIVVSMLLQKPRTLLVKLVGLHKSPRLLRAVKISVTFGLVCLAYVLFRANSLSDAIHMYSQIPFGWSHAFSNLNAIVAGQRPELLLAIVGIAVVLSVEALRDYRPVETLPDLSRWGIQYAVILSIVFFGALYSIDQQFIYFRF